MVTEVLTASGLAILLPMVRSESEAIAALGLQSGRCKWLTGIHVEGPAPHCSCVSCEPRYKHSKPAARNLTISPPSCCDGCAARARKPDERIRRRARCRAASHLGPDRAGIYVPCRVRG